MRLILIIKAVIIDVSVQNANLVAKKNCVPTLCEIIKDSSLNVPSHHSLDLACLLSAALFLRSQVRMPKLD